MAIDPRAGSAGGGPPIPAPSADRVAAVLYRLLWILCIAPIRLLWLREVSGLQNLPARGGYILASNHCSYLDFLVVPVSGCRLPRYMVGESLLRRPALGRLFRALGFIPVDRVNRRNAAALQAAVTTLERGGVVGIFPEGTRSPDGRLLPGRRGAAYLAFRTGCPIVPVGTIGTHMAWPRARQLPRPGRCAVRFGEPLHHRSADSGCSAEGLDILTRLLMRRIGKLCQQEYPW